MRRIMIGQLLKLVPKKKRKKMMIGYMIPKKSKNWWRLMVVWVRVKLYSNFCDRSIETSAVLNS